MDFGTSAVKVDILDADGRARGTASATYPLTRRPCSKVEIPPGVLFDAAYRACAEIPVEVRQQVGAVCYDAFSPSPVFTRADGSLAYPNIITHLDRRSRVESQRVLDTVGGDRFMEITGVQPIVGGVGILTALWMQANQPDVLAHTSHIGHLAGYVGLRLTGTWSVDRVNASMLGVYETTTDQGWSPELIEAFGLRAGWFGRITQPGSLLGTLRRSEARRLGVPAGVPVGVGTNDMAAAQVGAGNETAGSVMGTAGSSDMVSILTDLPLTNPHHYLRCSATPGLWQIYATTAGGFALDWFHREFCRELDREGFFNDLLPRALTTSPDRAGVTFAPFLSGDRQSLEPRRARWDGLTLHTSREEMLAALLLAMNRTLAETVERAAAVLPLQPVIKLSGGMATPAIIALKQQVFRGFGFEVVRNCSALGNMRLMQRHIDGTAGPAGTPRLARSDL
jgi:sugar (pentulose or hexulose) kinase